MTDPLSGNARRRSTMEWDRNNCIHTTKAAQVKHDTNIAAYSLQLLIKRIIKTHGCELAHFIAKLRSPEVNILHSTSALFKCFVEAKAASIRPFQRSK
jgi:hypothetical protein